MSKEDGFGGHEGNKYRKVERDFGGDRGRKKKKLKEAKVGQLKNSLDRHEHGEKTPEEEINSVLGFVKRQDEGSLEMKATTDYIEWLKERLKNPEWDFAKEKFGEFEKITASVGAGGAGRQTARNARARRHLITWIRATAEKSRKSFPNEELVMEKLEKRVRKHIENWKVVIKANKALKENLELIGEEVVGRMILI